MTAKPMTPEEIDLLYNLAPRKTGVDQPIVCVGQESFDRLIATARLAPQWRPGTEYPSDERCVAIYAAGSRIPDRGWCDHKNKGYEQWMIGANTAHYEPLWWHDWPKPPTAAPTQKGGGE